jgi:hypothetical protein
VGLDHADRQGKISEALYAASCGHAKRRRKQASFRDIGEHPLIPAIEEKLQSE